MSSIPRFAVPLAAHRYVLRILDQMDERLAAAKRNQPRGWWTRVAAVAAGLALIVAGIPMLVLPGPGVVAILLGLSVLAGQFRWARRLLANISSWARERLATLPTSEAAS